MMVYNQAHLKYSDMMMNVLPAINKKQLKWYLQFEISKRIKLIYSNCRFIYVGKSI